MQAYYGHAANLNRLYQEGTRRLIRPDISPLKRLKWRLKNALNEYFFNIDGKVVPKDYRELERDPRRILEAFYFAQMNGCPAAEAIIGHNLCEFVPPERRGDLRALLASLTDSEPPRNMQVVNRSADGREVIVKVRRAGIEERDSARCARAAYWGRRWFLVPNPMYGSWLVATGTDLDAALAAEPAVRGDCPGT